MKTIFLRVHITVYGDRFFACNDDDKEDLPEPAELQFHPRNWSFWGMGDGIP